MQVQEAATQPPFCTHTAERHVLHSTHTSVYICVHVRACVQLPHFTAGPNLHSCTEQQPGGVREGGNGEGAGRSECSQDRCLERTVGTSPSRLGATVFSRRRDLGRVRLQLWGSSHARSSTRGPSRLYACAQAHVCLAQACSPHAEGTLFSEVLVFTHWG